MGIAEMMQINHQLLTVCVNMDKDNSGFLTKEELFKGYEDNEDLQQVLGDMDISGEDLEVLWTCLDDDKNGTASYTDFVANAYKLKTSNTHFMLAYIKYYLHVIKEKICSELGVVQDELKKEEGDIDLMMNEVKQGGKQQQ